LKRKNTVSKHDIIRALKGMIGDIQILTKKVASIEYILSRYLEMTKKDKKLIKYMEKIQKESEKSE
tara:strand:+ start:4085 stop:4282 length:198 start_codon:yes stop_codon:yes gene_type:complete